MTHDEILKAARDEFAQWCLNYAPHDGSRKDCEAAFMAAWNIAMERAESVAREMFNRAANGDEIADAIQSLKVEE